MNKLRAYLRVICAPIRSFDISAQYFPSLPPGELCFWRPENFRAGGPKFRAGGLYATYFLEHVEC